MQAMMIQLAALLMLGVTVPTVAQDNSDAAQPPAQQPCSTEKHRQFDFWIGEWIVTSGEQSAGTNSIEVILGGCALQENWQGAGQPALTGTSFNIYDQANDKWHQTWVDTSGTLLELDGGMHDGNMVLSGERPSQNGGGMVTHRITWTPNRDGSVRQLWEASRDAEEWTVLFDGHYQRAPETQ